MENTYPAIIEIEKEESASKNEHRLVDKINEMIRSLEPPFPSSCCIYKVPMKLRKVNEAAYTPQTISIGPFHYGKDDNLMKMEKHKLRYLQIFLEEARKCSNKCLNDFVRFITTEKESICRCYAETFDHLKSDEFIQMILVDAGFIIIFFWNAHFQKHQEAIMNKHWMQVDIEQDLILLENQLPFFILEELCKLAFGVNPSFRQLTSSYFINYNKMKKSIEMTTINHFTDLLRFFELPPPQIHSNNNQSKVEHCFDLLTSFLPSFCQKPEETERSENVEHLYSATELHDAGVKFKSSPSKCLLEIKFVKGKGELKIPCLKFYDNTESYIRNLMALEQCHYPLETYICDYISTMNFLINTAKDVSLLVQKKIIVNWLEDHAAVATMVNKLDLNIIEFKGNCYSPLFKELNEYYEAPQHRWKARLREEYFNPPWRGASVVAAFILLMLTLIQTICAITSL